jgi:hypothetical protein
MSIVMNNAQVAIRGAMNENKGRVSNFGSAVKQRQIDKNPDCFTDWQGRSIGLLPGRPREISDAQTN